MMRSKALRSTIRSLTTGKAFARHGSIVIVSPSEPSHVELTDGGAAVRPVRDAVHDQAAHAADPFAAIGIERDSVLTAQFAAADGERRCTDDRRVCARG